MQYSLDTETSIWIIRARQPFLSRSQAQSPADIAISAMTLAELHFGALRSQDPGRAVQSVQAFVSGVIKVLPFDEDAAAIHAEFRQATRSQPIGERDLVIASVAAAHQLTLVTSNTREFARIPGLKLEDWS